MVSRIIQIVLLSRHRALMVTSIVLYFIRKVVRYQSFKIYSDQHLNAYTRRNLFNNVSTVIIAATLDVQYIVKCKINDSYTIYFYCKKLCRYSLMKVYNKYYSFL